MASWHSQGCLGTTAELSSRLSSCPWGAEPSSRLRVSFLGYGWAGGTQLRWGGCWQDGEGTGVLVARHSASQSHSSLCSSLSLFVLKRQTCHRVWPKSGLKIQCSAVRIPFPTCKEQKSACKMAQERNQAILGQCSHIQGKPKPTVTQMRNLRNQEPFELGTNGSLLGTGESLFLFDIVSYVM